MESKLQRAEEESIAVRTIILVITISAGLIAVSVFVMADIFESSYVGAYYSLAVLFDAVGYYPTVNVAFLSHDFYQFFTMLVVDGVARIILIGFVIATVIEFAGRVNLKYRLSVLTARKLRNHVVICGYSNFAGRLAKDLSGLGQAFVIIEKERGKVDVLHDLGYTAIDGDFTNETFLNEASIKRARAVVIDSGSDFEDAITVITIKRMNRAAKVIVRVKNAGALVNVMRAGADQCIIPEVLAGEEVGERMLDIG